MTATTGMILRHAAGIIRRSGWHRGDFYDHAQARTLGVAPEECRVCAVGAILLAAGVKLRRPVFFNLKTPAGEAAGEALRMFGLWVDVYPPEVGLEAAVELADDHIGSWNDWPGRTAEQVCATLEAAAGDAP